MRPGRTIDQLAESFEPLPQDYSPENYAAAHADWKELVARAKTAEINLETARANYLRGYEALDAANARCKAAEAERDEERERFHRHVETMIEPKLLARAEAAGARIVALEAALREIEAALSGDGETYFASVSRAFALARAALADGEATA